MPARARVEITATDKSKAAFAAAQKNAGKFSQAMTSVTRSIVGFASIGAIGAAIKQTVAFGSQLVDLELKLGTNIRVMSQYRGVLAQTGVSFNTFATALQRQSRRIAEAAKGAGEAKDAIAELGINVDELVRRRPDEQFEILATAINGVTNASDRARIGFKLWDAEGVVLLQTIRFFNGDLAAAREEVEKLGGTFDRQAALELKNFDISMRNLSTTVRGLVTDLVVKLGPSLGLVANLLRSLINLPIAAAKALGKLASAYLAFITFEFGDAIKNAKGAFSELKKGGEDAIKGIIAAWRDFESSAARAAAEMRKTKDELDRIVPVARETSDAVDDVAESYRQTADGARQAAIQARAARVEFQRTRTEAKEAAAAAVGGGGVGGGPAPSGSGLTVDTSRAFIFGIGQFRTLYVNGRGVRRLAPGESAAQALASVSQGSFATGTSSVPRDMVANLERGERVVSNNTTVNINFPGVPTNPNQFRDWVRSTLVPELRAAYR